MSWAVQSAYGSNNSVHTVSLVSLSVIENFSHLKMRFLAYPLVHSMDSELERPWFQCFHHSILSGGFTHYSSMLSYKEWKHVCCATFGAISPEVDACSKWSHPWMPFTSRAPPVSWNLNVEWITLIALNYDNCFSVSFVLWSCNLMMVRFRNFPCKTSVL